jgi:hypothetical protein
MPAIRFTPVINVAGTLPHGSVAVGDFNGDGKLDLVAPTIGANGVDVMLGNGDGTFQPAKFSATPAATGRESVVAVGDFNGDGIPDLVVNAPTGNTLSVLRGVGNGTFVPFPTGTLALTGGACHYVVVGDLTGTGKLSIVAEDGNGTVDVFLGNGNGTFQPKTNYAGGGPGSSWGVAVGDMDGNGDLDIVLSNYSSNTQCVLLNDGTGHFPTRAPGSPFSTGAGGSLAPQIGDFNGDGHNDVLTPDFLSNQASILLGSATGALANKPPSPYAVGANPYSATIADFNGDGKLDFATANLSGGAAALSVYQGNGDGTFTAVAGLPGVPTGPRHIVAADFNGDGAPDLVLASETSSNLYVYLNEGGTRTSLTSSANPSTFGQAVTFTATVAASVVGATPPNPTGTVQFLDNGVAIGTGTLTASGQASFTTSSLTVGTHNITAVYQGDANFHSSLASAVVTETVNRLGSTTLLVSSLNPSNVGQPVTFTATVSGAGPVAPTGTVMFLDGTTPIGSGTLSGGKASITVSTLSAGSHQITAVYAGDANYLTSTSAALNEVVNASASSDTTKPPPFVGLGFTLAVSDVLTPSGQMVMEVVSSTGILTQFDATGAHQLATGVRSASVAFGQSGEVLIVVYQDGRLFQFDAGGAHLLASAVLSASVTFAPGGMQEVLEVVFANGTLVQFDATGAHQLTTGVHTASAAFGAGGEVLDLVLQDGRLFQFDATGSHLLASGVTAAAVALSPAGPEVLDVIFADNSLWQFDATGGHKLGTV